MLGEKNVCWTFYSCCNHELPAAVRSCTSLDPLIFHHRWGGPWRPQPALGSCWRRRNRLSRFLVSRQPPTQVLQVTAKLKGSEERKRENTQKQNRSCLEEGCVVWGLIVFVSVSLAQARVICKELSSAEKTPSSECAGGNPGAFS